MRKTWRGLVAASFVAAGLAAVVSAPARAEKWDLPGAYPDTNFQTMTAVGFAKEVTEKSGGKLQIVVHGGGALIKGDQIKRAVQTGQVAIGERLMSALSNENVLFGVDAVPFLATDFAASKKLLAAARPALEKLLDSQGMIALYYVPWPPQGLYSKKPINTVADMKGLKFRAYNPATARIAQLTGAVPVQIEAAELSQALATGVAESFISSGATGVDSKVWEQLNYFYDVKAWLPWDFVIVNKEAFGKLDPATQAVVKTAAANAEAAGWKTSEDLAQGYLKTLAEKGMKVEQPSPALKAELTKVGETLTKEWIEKAGPTGQEVIQAYQK